MPPNNLINNLTSQLQNYVIMKGDSGATSHYVRPQDKECLKNIVDYAGPSVLLPDADKISPSHQGALNIHEDLSNTACVGTILPNLKSSSLLSLGQICDDGCDILLNKKKLYALKDKKIVLQGFRNRSDGLWDIPVAKRVVHANNYIAPPTHAAMYTSTIQPSSAPPICKPHTTNKANDYLHIFADMNDLIDVNETNILVDQQLKRDMQDFKLANITPTLNVIIRKKQPQLEQSNYLYLPVEIM